MTVSRVASRSIRVSSYRIRALSRTTHSRRPSTIVLPVIRLTRTPRTDRRFPPALAMRAIGAAETALRREGSSAETSEECPRRAPPPIQPARGAGRRIRSSRPRTDCSSKTSRSQANVRNATFSVQGSLRRPCPAHIGCCRGSNRFDDPRRRLELNRRARASHRWKRARNAVAGGRASSARGSWLRSRTETCCRSWARVGFSRLAGRRARASRGPFGIRCS